MINEKLAKLDVLQTRKDFPKFKVGDNIKVHVRIKEGEKTRIQIFEGLIIAMKNSGLRETFTVRKISYGIGVERTFPINSPNISQIELVRRNKIRRAKLYYMRDLTGKATRLKEIRIKKGE
ncbi:MAG: 50S ribosomal protein L19 [Metamycoplasmataceae bacterium]